MRALFLTLVSTCFALLLVETAVRVFYPHSKDHVIPGGLFAMDDELGWTLKPGHKRTHHSRYFDAIYATNSLGYRDKPRILAKHAYRILIYGDSQVFGWGIPEEQRFSNLMESRRSALEVWNLAVPGYGLDQEILSYERGGKELDADQVIFFVSSSTLSRIRTGYVFQKYKPMFRMDRDGNLRLVPVPKGRNAVTGFLYQMLSPFYLPYFVELEITALRQSLAKPGGVRQRTIGDFEQKMLLLARDLGLKRNQQVTVLTDLPEDTKVVFRDFCGKSGIGLLEIALEGFREDDITFGASDRHWNAHAQELIAEQLLSQLKTNRSTRPGER